MLGHIVESSDYKTVLHADFHNNISNTPSNLIYKYKPFWSQVFLYVILKRFLTHL